MNPWPADDSDCAFVHDLQGTSRSELICNKNGGHRGRMYEPATCGRGLIAIYRCATNGDGPMNCGCHVFNQCLQFIASENSCYNPHISDHELTIVSREWVAVKCVQSLNNNRSHQLIWVWRHSYQRILSPGETILNIKISDPRTSVPTSPMFVPSCSQFFPACFIHVSH